MYVPDSSSTVREGSGWLQLAMRPDLLPLFALGMVEHHLLASNASIANTSAYDSHTTSLSVSEPISIGPPKAAVQMVFQPACNISSVLT